MGTRLFVLIYGGSIATLLSLDSFGVLHSSGVSAWKNFPPRESWGHFSTDANSLRLVLFALCVLTPLLHVWRSFLKGIVFSRLASYSSGAKPGSVRHEKFVESAWLALHYTTVTTLGYKVLSWRPWWPPVIDEQARFSLLAGMDELKLDRASMGLPLLYCVQLSFYFLELVTLLISTKKKGDQVVMFVHHVYTVILLAGSWLTYDHRLGSLVLILHDVGDIFLPIGKCFTYSEKHVKKNCSAMAYQIVQASGIGFFVLFIITFAIPRIFFFGGLIYYTMYELGWLYCAGGGYDPATCIESKAPLFSSSLVFILFLLWPMHVFWLYLIARMVNKVLTGHYQDVRSDDEDEGQDEQQEKKQM